MATKSEVVELAHRLIGVAAHDEALTADQSDFGTDLYDGLAAELLALHSVTVPATIPSGVMVHMANAVAADLAGHYGVPGPSRASAIMKVRAYYLPDDRDNSKDLDDDGTVTDAEAETAAYGQYY